MSEEKRYGFKEAWQTLPTRTLALGALVGMVALATDYLGNVRPQVSVAADVQRLEDRIFAMNETLTTVKTTVNAHHGTALAEPINRALDTFAAPDLVVPAPPLVE